MEFIGPATKREENWRPQVSAFSRWAEVALSTKMGAWGARAGGGDGWAPQVQCGHVSLEMLVQVGRVRP